METRNKNCQNCKTGFTILPEDFSFYEKIKVPRPSWCPECRLIRRFSFQNTHNLCWRNCDKCGKKTLSVYSPEQKVIVYCQPCWWADDWDGTEYGMDYDPNVPFLKQLKELSDKTPRYALATSYTTLKNSEYSKRNVIDLKKPGRWSGYSCTADWILTTHFCCVRKNI